MPDSGSRDNGPLEYRAPGRDPRTRVLVFRQQVLLAANATALAIAFVFYPDMPWRSVVQGRLWSNTLFILFPLGMLMLLVGTTMSAVLLARTQTRAETPYAVAIALTALGAAAAWVRMVVMILAD